MLVDTRAVSSADVDLYIKSHAADMTRELVEFCRIASEPRQIGALRDAAVWVTDRLERLGAEVDIVRPPGDSDVPPLVVGEIGSGARTLNLVHHYDVQPADPLDLWAAPPFDPRVERGRIFARGATDNKGELLARIYGIEAYLAAIGELPLRIRFIVEGEEEMGSGHLNMLLDQRPETRRADGALMEGGGIDPLDRPVIECGVRGMLAVEMSIRTLSADVHSAAAPILDNAAKRLVVALSTLWDSGGEIAVDGYLDDVRRPSDVDRASVRALPTDDLILLRTAHGAKQFFGGRDAAAAMEAMTFEPTMNLQAIWAGYSGPGHKNVVPAEARARLDLRLVPDQDPERVLALLRAHMDRHGLDDVTMETMEATYRPWWTPMDSPIVHAARRASEAILEQPAIVSPSAPGTAPMWQICRRHDVPAVSLGGARNDCMAHAPNENYRLDDAERAARITARFVTEFASLG